jgi:hypothetical protein
MHQTTLICDGTITADKDVVCYCLSEHLNLEHVCDNFFRLSIYIRMYQSDMIVAGDYIAKSRQTFLDSLDRYGVR